MREAVDLHVIGTEARDELSLVGLANLAAELVRHVDQETFLSALGNALTRIVDFDNYIVFRYQERCAAELIHTNLQFTKLRADMAPYINGLYLLDPFYIAATSGRRRGFLHIEAAAPEAFQESEFFRMFYKDVNVIDEARFMIELNGEELIHILLEREAPNRRYSALELRSLECMETLVDSLLEKHWEWRSMSASVHCDERTPLSFGVRNVIRNLRRKALTAREIDIVELTIKGHSSKSIAYELGISEGTVINHKRNIYGKLEICSQSQLFHLFLQELYGRVPGTLALPRS
jgi:DNA-binding CsgD family transcriptional regulator